ncbi:orotidine-5'-phosphate decarboxylase [Halioxenophilus aromaticivorans]|uniref:Orotidine 5'-phosphate decarboxylase n=1 Tax=Halioxenophilus aromaticivorans TaxID=1306992 RepID=A0AAV3TZZ0_9ALTE
MSNSSLAGGNASSATKQIIVALDYDCAQDALAMGKLLDPSQCRVKVGKELFTAAGPAVVEGLQTMGFEVFLDLKFHDIPNTCAKAVKAAAELGVWMVNVHASGGEKMMAAAKDVLTGVSGRAPILIGVTVLTSMSGDDLASLGLTVSTEQQVMKLAALVQKSGLDGVVCSAQEAQQIKQQLGRDFVTVTPGIRPAGSDANDQVRITTPEQAISMGSDYLVVGRPITQAPEPKLACQQIISSIS